MMIDLSQKNEIKKTPSRSASSAFRLVLPFTLHPQQHSLILQHHVPLVMSGSVLPSCTLLMKGLLALSFVAMTSAVDGTMGSSQDPTSYGNVDQFMPTHIEMDYAIDFDQSATYGTVTHTLMVLEDAMTVYFDVGWDAVQVSKAEFRGPIIELPPPDVDVEVAQTEKAGKKSDDGFLSVEFAITTPNPNHGNALAVTLPATPVVGEIIYIRFTFLSLPETLALDWLTPAMTADKTMPFVYSLCQMNFCRDWMPMIDSPSQKITYNATILAPTEFVVSMSGNETSKVAVNDTHSTTVFECNLKIPSYQIALIVGDLASQPLSDRIIVFAEPSVLDAALAEFEDLPAILDMTEEYLTPYIWGVYSIFVMPPSFPWGGMEHINANQVSPTLLAGDKSMLGTAINEITHSWFGNDIGCQNWDNFWINEGMNTWMERKVMEAMYGKDYTKIEYFNGNTSLFNDIMFYGVDNTYSSLFPDIGEDDPENSFSRVPYEKGSQFAHYIEMLLGKDAMQQFIRAYIGEFTQMAINSPEMKAFYETWVMENFPENSTEIITMTDWDTWVYTPGLAPAELDFFTDALQESIDLATQYLVLEGAASPENFLDYNGYLRSQKEAFVDTVCGSEMVTPELLALIDKDLNLSTGETNPSVKTRWYICGIQNLYEPVLDPSYIWLGQQGRSAFVTPIFRALVNDANDCETAQAWFADYKDTYNSYVQWEVGRVLEACEEETTSPTEAPTGAGTMPSFKVFTATFAAAIVALISFL